MLCEICTKSKTTFWWSQLERFHLFCFDSFFSWPFFLLLALTHLHFSALFCNRHFTLLWVVTNWKEKHKVWNVLMTRFVVFAHDNERVWALLVHDLHFPYDVDRKTMRSTSMKVLSGNACKYTQTQTSMYHFSGNELKIQAQKSNKTLQLFSFNKKPTEYIAGSMIVQQSMLFI